MSEHSPVALTIGAFAHAIRSPADLPPGVVHEAKRSLLNFVGGAISVARDPALAATLDVLLPFAGPAEVTLIGRPERADRLTGAFVNAVSANLLDYDDTHLRTVIHPTAPVAPAALALGECLPVSGADVLTAFALGAEIECRIGNAVTGGHYARGWHITATCGVFGAALAAAHLLRLGPQQTAHALGIAASSAAGIVENLPTGAKNVGVGNSARGGLVAAAFAAKGFDGAPRAIEGPLGWARAAGDAPDVEAIVGGLGDRWELLLNTYKPYPCGIVMHAVIDACLELRERHDLDPAHIEAVIVSGDALLLARGDRVVRNERDARVSIHHTAACAFLWGRAGIAEFAEARSMSSEAQAFRARVRAERDGSLPQGAARVTVRLAGGREHTATVLHARGSAEKPLSDADLEGKLAELCAHAGTGLDAGSISGHIWRLDGLADVRQLLACTVPSRDSVEPQSRPETIGTT